ncbi:MAG: divalent-cation tolerance protein CutA, partial [bacterium]
EAVVAITTTNNEREARQLAERMVRDRLAACVQIVPKIQSIYEWDGEIHDDLEHMLIIKTREKCVENLKAFIEKNHSYEVPELLVLPVTDGLEDYFKWMKDNTKG